MKAERAADLGCDRRLGWAMAAREKNNYYGV